MTKRRPEKEGIKTSLLARMSNGFMTKRRPEKEGIKTVPPIVVAAGDGQNADLKKKGLRPAVILLRRITGDKTQT